MLILLLFPITTWNRISQRSRCPISAVLKRDFTAPSIIFFNEQCGLKYTSHLWTLGISSIAPLETQFHNHFFKSDFNKTSSGDSAAVQVSRTLLKCNQSGHLLFLPSFQRYFNLERNNKISQHQFETPELREIFDSSKGQKVSLNWLLREADLHCAGKEGRMSGQNFIYPFKRFFPGLFPTALLCNVKWELTAFLTDLFALSNILMSANLSHEQNKSSSTKKKELGEGLLFPTHHFP